MNEATRKKLLYVLLALAVLWGGWNITHPRKRYQPGTEPVTATTSEVSSASAAPAPVSVEQKRAEAWGRDPFRSQNQAANTRFEPTSDGATATHSVSTGWSLTGIIYHATNPMAFINGHMVRIGDTIDRARVVTIDKTKVTLSVNGTHFDLFVNKG